VPQEAPQVHIFLDQVWRVCRAAAPATDAVPKAPVPKDVMNVIAYVDLYTLANVTTGAVHKRGMHVMNVPCNPIPSNIIYPLRAEPVCLYNDTRACLRVMAEPERYLEHMYGPDWRQPPNLAKQKLHGKGTHVCTPLA